MEHLQSLIIYTVCDHGNITQTFYVIKQNTTDLIIQLLFKFDNWQRFQLKILNKQKDTLYLLDKAVQKFNGLIETSSIVFVLLSCQTKVC